ncbi:ABC transporter substrate-binding protein [Vannielia litorea]|nr:ABC transporter substrate-binding protein [Vannielia litorea]
METMMKRRDFLRAGSATIGGAALLPFLRALPASAAAGDDTLLVVIGDTINSLDLHRTGTNRPSYQVAVNIYDRLVRFGTKTLDDGTIAYDSTVIEPEIAESWEVAEDGKSITFKISPKAKFWDGSQVTAEDVKWSFDRAVTLGGFPLTQMKAGSMSSPEQFVVVDEMTFRVDLPAPSKLALPDLAVPVPLVINSKVAMEHATEDDPWATEYLHENPAGSGPYKVTRWDAGQQFVYERNEDWALGTLPPMKRVIVREVPSAATRRALLERGDVDFYMDVPSKDAKEMAESGVAKVEGAPIDNCLHVLGLNVAMAPFDNKLVRQAIAFALPYEDILAAGAYGRGKPMWGGSEASPSTTEWPQPFPYATDLEKAKALMEEAGFADGFETTLSYNLGLADWMEPTALLIQESLAKIGITATLDKIPGANWRTAALVEKRLPMHLENFGGWLNYPDYYFYWAYIEGHLFNSSNYSNPEIASLVEETLTMETDDPAYEPNIKRMIEIAFEDVPRIPLYQPYLDAAMKPEVEGYVSWFHRQLAVTNMAKG